MLQQHESNLRKCQISIRKAEFKRAKLLNIKEGIKKIFKINTSYLGRKLSLLFLEFLRFQNILDLKFQMDLQRFFH